MHLYPIAVAVGVVVLALAAFRLLRIADRTGAAAHEYYLRESLYSPAERSFLGVLEALKYDGMVVASKVRLADIFGVKKGLGRGGRQGALNRINAKHVDFLLIRESDGRPLLGIELDDRSHKRDDRKERDHFVDSLYSSTGLPIVHVAVRASYDLNEVRKQIDAALGSRI